MPKHNIKQHPVDIRSISHQISPSSGYFTKISRITNWLFPTSAVFITVAPHFDGLFIPQVRFHQLQAIEPDGKLPWILDRKNKHCGGFHQWGYPHSWMVIIEHPIGVPQFQETSISCEIFYRTFRQSPWDRKHRCDANPTEPRQSQPLLLLLRCRGMQSGHHSLSQPPPQHLPHREV